MYLARDLKHERAVALEVLRPELAATLGPERFLREIRTAARFRHPLLPLHGSGVADGFYYTMPYVEGETLRDDCGGNRSFPWREAARIAGDRRRSRVPSPAGIVHRDIKPENCSWPTARPWSPTRYAKALDLRR